MRLTSVRSVIAGALLLCLMLMTPLCAQAQDGDPAPEAAEAVTMNSAHWVLSYGPATVDDLYGEQWDGESLRLSFTYFEGYYGLGVGMEFLDVRTNTRGLEGIYDRRGVEAMFYLTPGVHWVIPYAGMGLGAHYNDITLSGNEDFTGDGFGFRAIGEAGLRVETINVTVFGTPARLVLGGYGRYSTSIEYFFGDTGGTKTTGFHTMQYGIELGLSFGL